MRRRPPGKPDRPLARTAVSYVPPRFTTHRKDGHPTQTAPAPGKPDRPVATTAVSYVPPRFTTHRKDGHPTQTAPAPGEPDRPDGLRQAGAGIPPGRSTVTSPWPWGARRIRAWSAKRRQGGPPPPPGRVPTGPVPVVVSARPCGWTTRMDRAIMTTAKPTTTARLRNAIVVTFVMPQMSRRPVPRRSTSP